MNGRIFAVAASFAVMVLAGAHPAAAAASAQCLAACDKTFQTCNGTNPDTSVCLPKWGQCKRACAGPVTPVKAAAPAAPVKPVAANPKAATPKTTKIASATVKK